ETMLRAFRGYDAWEQRSGIRTWLYRIATNVCLDAQRAARRRPLPAAVGMPTNDIDPTRLAAADPEFLWMSPVADAVLRGDRDPADHAEAQVGVRLALIAALQYLTPTQRAIFILRDVLMWHADETAEALRLTVPSINNHLLRARRRIRDADVRRDDLRETPDQRRAVEGYLGAFVDAAPDRLAALLTEDVVFEMPPHTSWFAGRETVAAFLRDRVAGGAWRGVLTRANGQPAAALYLRESSGEFRPEGIHVLDVTAAGIAHVVAFRDPGLFGNFGLPGSLTELGS
ncbi:RNA polymerase subunit sigma-70, partial [Kribbella sp.]|uniref:RNA polymerase subunit sigma-70 n=1 Tax=Kribbella sp. TaxID=1871183 RepID=UPI002D6FBCDE